MWALHYSTWPKITRTLKRKNSTDECPCYEILAVLATILNCWEKEEFPYSARIAIDALEGASIKLILTNLVVHPVIFNDAAAMSLHVLVCTQRSNSCSWDL
jgi:hypothetical protein